MIEINKIKGLKKTSFNNKFVEFRKEKLNEEFSDSKIQFVSKPKENTQPFALVEEVKTAIHQLIYQTGIHLNQNIQDYISEKVDNNYFFLNNFFKLHTGISIMSYLNLQKIELIKELLIYDQLNIELIASKLNYRNATHLFEEFRKERIRKFYFIFHKIKLKDSWQQGSIFLKSS